MSELYFNKEEIVVTSYGIVVQMLKEDYDKFMNEIQSLTKKLDIAERAYSDLLQNSAKEIRDLTSKLEKAREALKTMIISHINLYEMAFECPPNDPQNDCILRDAQQALKEIDDEK